ncbi:MAG: N-acetyltransferase family protein [Rickettsiales bacterium]
MPIPVIRTATAKDCDAIAALLEELSRDEGKPCRVTPEHVRLSLFTPRAVELRAQVAEISGEVIGATLYYSGYDTLSAGEGYHLAEIVVTAAHRRCGVARALLAALSAQCLREGGKWLSLTVLRDNAPARGFYEALGMTHVAVDFYAMGPNALMKISG